MQTFSHPVIYFEIPVLDLERAMKFYEAVFNATFEKAVVHDNEMAFFPLYNNNSGISGALAKGSIYKPTIEGTLVYFRTDNIQKTLETALNNKATLLFPVTESGDWGWVAEFKDCEGNRIALQQPFES